MSRENQMNNVGVFEMAERREKRAAEQQDMLARCGLPLVCINMNIAGPVKRGALIDWAFFRALNAAANSFKGKIRGFAFTNEKTGIEAMLAVDAAAESLKKQAESIEKEFPEGRLFDIDVIGTDGLKLSRNVPRKCLICGQPAAACARSRTHSAEELRKATAELLKKAAAQHYSELAAQALIREVHTTPKPGLVDENNSGANDDMDAALFELSTEAVQPFFAQMAKIALDAVCTAASGFSGDFSGNAAFGRSILPNGAVSRLKQTGILAEKAMLAATGGVNTHRGAIFSIGLSVCAAALSAAGAEGHLPLRENAGERIAKLAGKLAEAFDYERNSGSNGAIVRRKYGVGGAIEQAKAGFPLAIVAKSLHEEYNIESNGQGSVDSWAFALLGIMAELEDNNALKRGGNAGARFVKRRAAFLLSKRTMLTEAELLDFDDELIRRGISCGGAADMLAAAIFLSLADEEQRGFAELIKTTL